VRNRRRVVYYAILLLLILGELLGERNYIIIIFPEYDTEQLFTKIRNDFGETSEEERKIEQLRIIEQGGRMCDEYVQEFKKVARGSSYEG